MYDWLYTSDAPWNTVIEPNDVTSVGQEQSCLTTASPSINSAQWIENGHVIAGESALTLTAPDRWLDNGTFTLSCRVVNYLGSDMSPEITFTLLSAYQSILIPSSPKDSLIF